MNKEFLAEKYILGNQHNKDFLREQRKALLDFAVDFPSPKGSSYYLGDNGVPDMLKPRETWITSRMVYSYCLGNLLGREADRDLAEIGMSGLLEELWDNEHGGYYSGLTKDDEPLPDKMCYAHAFVILAASSAILAELPRAWELFNQAMDIFIEKFWQGIGLTIDGWDRDFTCMHKYRGLNSNMHTVEALLAAADATREVKYRNMAGQIINHVIVWAKDNNYRIPEHFTENWEPILDYNIDKKDDPFKPYGATPGHGMEWARLIVQWALCSEQDNRDYIEIAKNLYNRARSDAWNIDSGPGFCYTTDWQGMPVVTDRMHWTLAEAINTAAVLYNVTGNEQYAKDYYEYMEYLDKLVLDKVNGSWFHELSRDNIKKSSVWVGKPDIYHALQAMLIPYGNPAKSIALTVSCGYE